MTDVTGRMLVSCQRFLGRNPGNAEAQLLHEALQDLKIPPTLEWS